MISFEIIEDLDKMKEYDTKWDQIFDSGECEASLSYEWTQALLNTHLERDVFLLLILRDPTEILGIIPLCLRKIKKYGLTLLTLSPVSEYFNTHSDLLLKNASEELLEVFINALFSLKAKWDVFRINRFAETNPVLNLITFTLQEKFNLKYDIQKAEPSFFIQLGNNYHDYLKIISAKFRYKLKIVSKKMHSIGKVAFLRNHDFHDFGKAYDIILSIEENSWKHKNGTGITSSEKKREFYRELGHRAFNNGRLRFCILYLNHEPIAYEMGLVKDKKYYSVHGSYDEIFKKENPGTMLLAQFIEELIHDGIKEFDFFGEPFEWQNYWTDKLRWHKSLLIYNKTPKAKLFFIYNALKNKLKHNEKNQIVLINPRDIKS